jgi:cellulose synthase/poly-beta-1,6-N-acetylglucosamine synthase-like glycosyltransferase
MLIAIIISIILFLSYAALILFYYNAWKIIPVSGFLNSNHSTKVSIIIPARNEEQNILDCLASLKNQMYPKNLYEVIVVDDHSTDNTWNILQSFSNEEMNFKKLKLSDYITDSTTNKAYKKLAIGTAINNTDGNLIVTSDADCTFNNNWLQTIVSFYETTNAKFIAAPVKIKCNNNLLDIFQTLDFITLQGITAASVSKKFHSMCNGANLAYEKSVFFEVDGFKNIDNIPSGDDMLLMHKIYKKYPKNVFYLKNKNAIVTTQSQSSWKNFFNQRIRWASKADVYDDKRIFWVLLLVYCFNLLFLVLAIAAFWNIQFLLIAAALLILKTFIEFLFVKSVAKFFNQQSLMIYFSFLQSFHILYIIISGFFGKFRSYQWKGRMVSSKW